MKILMTTAMPPASEAPGAIPLVLQAQVRALWPRHDLTIVTAAGPDPAEWKAVEHLRGAGVKVHAVPRTEPQGIHRWQRRWRFTSMWLRGKYPFRTIWFWELGVQQTLDRILSEKEYDLVTVEDNAAGAYRYQTRSPILLTEHEVRRPRAISWRTRSKESWLKWALSESDWQRWPGYERAVWSRYDRIQVFTPRDAASLCAIAPELGDRVRVNPFGVEVPALCDPALEQKDEILFVGNFTHPPNVDAALFLGREIVPILRSRRPGAHLTIVGYSPPESVRALAGEEITVTGQVPEIGPYFERAAVVVAPIRTGGGQRMKVLQSLAWGKAVVATPRAVDGLELGGSTVPAVVQETAGGIASACAALLDSTPARREFGLRARAFVMEHYSPLAYARRLEAVYAELQAAPSARMAGRGEGQWG